MKTEKRDLPQTLLHRVVIPEIPGAINKGLASNPSLLAICTGEPVPVNNPDGSVTTYNPDGTTSVATSNPDGTTSVATYAGNDDDPILTKVNEYNRDGKLARSTEYDPSSNIRVKTTEFIPGTKTITSETLYDPNSGKPVEEIDYEPGTESITKKMTYDPPGKHSQTEVFHKDGSRTVYDFDVGRKTVYDSNGKARYFPH